jgi:DNA polymerase III subunit alpha
MVKIIVFDTETAQDNGEHMVSICCTTFIDGARILELDLTVKPEGWKINSHSKKIHGISTKYATENGKPIRTVMTAFFGAISNGGLLVAHNAAYDVRIARTEFEI